MVYHTSARPSCCLSDRSVSLVACFVMPSGVVPSKLAAVGKSIQRSDTRLPFVLLSSCHMVACLREGRSQPLDVVL